MILFALGYTLLVLAVGMAIGFVIAMTMDDAE